MSKAILIKQLDNFVVSRKKYINSINKLKTELKQTGINLKHICTKINIPYSTILFQFKTGKMPAENFKKLAFFLD